MPAYRIARLCSGTEDGWLWYVVDGDGNRVSGDGWLNKEDALIDLLYAIAA